MPSAQLASACRQIGRLFGTGTVAGLAEGQLLDRFVARRDDAAFEAIVARHGPMVLAVCRSLLHDPNDVDDAFQAVFLVLVRRAGSVRHRDALGPWLHGVARRVASRARSESMRRRDRTAVGPEPVTPAVDVDDFDDRAAIHAEVDRLPGSYRAAVVLCYFEGRTHEEAARELGWPVGTVRGRLARARDLLRGRLARRGVGLTSGALLASLAGESRAAVPGVLLDSTTKAAALAAAGPLAAMVAPSAIVSARALDLARGALPAMTASKLKLAATLVVAGLVVGPGAAAQQSGDGPVAKAAAPRPDDQRTEEGTRRLKAAPFVPVATAEEPARPPAERAPESQAAAQLRIAEEAIAELNRAIEAAAQNPSKSRSPGPQSREEAELTQWTQRAEEARREIDGPNYNYNDAVRRRDSMRDKEAQARQAIESGNGSKVAYLQAQYDRISAEAKVAQEDEKRRQDRAFLKPGGEPAAKPAPDAKPAKARPDPATASAAGPAARLKVAEEAIDTIQEELKKPNVDPELAAKLDHELRFWTVFAEGARHELGGPDPAYLNALRGLESARSQEDFRRKQFDSGKGSKLDYLRAQISRIQQQEQVNALSGDGSAPGTSSAVIGAAEPQGSRPGPNPGPGPAVRSNQGEALDGGATDEAPRLRRLPKVNPADAERDKAIEEALEKTASVKFAEGATLAEVLAFFRESTKEAKAGMPKGVPFYVDPLVLSDKERAKGLVTIAPIELDDVPLRVALRLALDQFGLSYQVRDRIVYIIDEDLLDFRSEGAGEFRKANGGMGGMGGGMGGMGGGMGGPGGMGGGFR